jgi:hypothetical protein
MQEFVFGFTRCKADFSIHPVRPPFRGVKGEKETKKAWFSKRRSPGFCFCGENWKLLKDKGGKIK